MEHEFECYRCGQRMSATSELIGTEAACPSCNEPFIVPAPEVAEPEPSLEPELPEVAELMALMARVRELGYNFSLPSEITVEALHWHLSALDEFLSEHADFLEAIDEMERTGQIIGRPTEEELHALGDLLLVRVLAGEWGGTPEELGALLGEVAPNIRTSAE